MWRGRTESWIQKKHVVYQHPDWHKYPPARSCCHSMKIHFLGETALFLQCPHDVGVSNLNQIQVASLPHETSILPPLQLTSQSPYPCRPYHHQNSRSHLYLWNASLVIRQPLPWTNIHWLTGSLRPSSPPWHHYHCLSLPPLSNTTKF